MEYYLVIKRSKLLTHAKIWRNLKKEARSKRQNTMRLCSDDIPETAKLYTVIRLVAARGFVGLPW